MNDAKNNTLKIEEGKPAQQKVDLKKSNPKEYYSQSSISFKELSRSSQKLSDDIQNLASQIETSEVKIAALKTTLNTKKELFALVNNQINTRIQKGQI